jgi:hypothetical protein
MCKNFLALIRFGEKGYNFRGKSPIKSSVLMMQPKFNSGMCPPCLSQKLKIELKQTQFLPVCTPQPKTVEDDGREEGNIKSTTRQISNPYISRHFIEK